ncbi:hypothetical protein RZS08_63930, partial [Arthrospira platensis SPKY1]|nr:hypothetical protein [Arthrospira platensis SPKY1]
LPGPQRLPAQRLDETEILLLLEPEVAVVPPGAGEDIGRLGEVAGEQVNDAARDIIVGKDDPGQEAVDVIPFP